MHMHFQQVSFSTKNLGISLFLQEYNVDIFLSIRNNCLLTVFQLCQPDTKE